MKAGLIILIVHLIVVCIIVIGIKIRRFHISRYFLPTVLLIPVFGPCAGFAAELVIRKEENGKYIDKLEAIKKSEETGGASIEVEVEKGTAVPLEDALLINDNKLRRSIMIDVLMDESDDYARVLNEARLNDDTEVVHYATTAMVELSKNREMQAQEYAVRYAKDSENVDLLGEYINYMESYLNDGILEGQLLMIHRDTYQKLLQDKIAKSPEKKDYIRLLRAYIDSRMFTRARDLIESLDEKIALSEEILKMKLEIAYDMADIKMLRNLVSAIDSSEKYYSRSFRENLEFWKKEGFFE